MWSWFFRKRSEKDDFWEQARTETCIKMPPLPPNARRPSDVWPNAIPVIGKSPMDNYTPPVRQLEKGLIPDTDSQENTDWLQQNYPETYQAFEESFQECRDLFARKQQDYGPGNIDFGDRNLTLLAIAIRSRDKIMRLINLLSKDKAPANESIHDSFVDLVNYGLIATVVEKDKWGK